VADLDPDCATSQNWPQQRLGTQGPGAYTHVGLRAVAKAIAEVFHVGQVQRVREGSGKEQVKHPSVGGD
jgi:hypothetical protein